MLKQKFQKIMMLCLAFVGISINASAIDLESTLDFTTNPWDMIIGTNDNGANVYPNITTAGKTNGCNIADKEWNGITFSGTVGCNVSGYTSISDGFKNNSSQYYPTLRHSTSYFDDKIHLLISRYNTFTMTAPDGYAFSKIVLHYATGGTTQYNGDYVYGSDHFVPFWTTPGTYTTAEDGNSGTYDASAAPVTSATVECHASRAMWVWKIDFTLVSTGGPVATKYNVNMDSEMVGGSVEVSPSAKVEEGTEVTLTPKAASGYTYNAGSLTVTNNTTSTAISLDSNNKFKMPASDVTVSAAFTANTYTITVVDPSGNGTASADKTTAHKGETVTLTATPNEGYELVGWVEKNDYVDVFTNNTFIMPAVDVTINPVFAKPKHTVSKSVTGYGTVNLSSTSVSEGAAFRVTATPATGYELQSIVVTDDVTGDVIAQDAEIANTYEMPAHNVTVTVVFAKITYTITVDSNIANGTVTASSATAQYGDQVTLTATPATGYEFKSWNVTSTRGTVTVNNNKFSMPAGNVTVSATFAKASAGWTFDDATFTPALNTPVESISTIKIDYNGIEPIGTSGGDNGISPFSGKVGTISNGVTTYAVYAGNDFYSQGYLTLSVYNGPEGYITITEPGTWTLHFDSKSLTAYVDKSTNGAMNYTFIIAGSAPENVEIPISAAGYATYVTEYPLDFTGNAIEAFAVSDVNAYAGKMTLTKLAKVPAGEAIIVKGETGNVPVIESAAKIDNQLAHHDTDIVVSEWTGTSFYGLAEGSKGVGFYPVTGTIAAGKGFISVTEMAGAAKSLVFDFGDATGINNVKAAQSNVMFNLAGQRIKNANGLVIKNGKKYVK